MVFKKGDPRPASSGRKKGSGNRTNTDIKAALRQHAPEMIRELLRLATSAKNEATRVAAIKECLDRVLGKASQPVEGQVLFGVSAELARLLDKHDGQSRSVPTRTIDGELMDLNGNGSDHGNNGGDNGGGGLRS